MSNSKNNSLALVSMISGIVNFVSCFGCLFLVSIITGFIALYQIKKTNESGKGMAVAGIVLGFASLLVYAVVGIIYGALIIASLGLL